MASIPLSPLHSTLHCSAYQVSSQLRLRCCNARLKYTIEVLWAGGATRCHGSKILLATAPDFELRHPTSKLRSRCSGLLLVTPGLLWVHERSLQVLPRNTQGLEAIAECHFVVRILQVLEVLRQGLQDKGLCDAMLLC